MIIYLDVLLATNLIINFLLIHASGMLCKRQPSKWRMVASVLIATASSLLIFLPEFDLWISLLIKIFIASIIVLVGFGFTCLSLYLKELLIFLGVNCVFAGVMLGMWMFSSSPAIYSNNGMFYIDLSFFTLLLSTVIAYFMIEIFCKISAHKALKEERCSVSITGEDKTVFLQGFWDSGNSLTDLLTGLPVVVAWYPKIQSILPLQVQEYITSGITSAQTKEKQNFQLVLYHGVGSAGMLPAFKPDQFIVMDDAGNRTSYEVLIAVSKQKLRQGEFDLLLNREMIPEKERVG